ncbi:MAG: DEAD/DEAH box helicase [Pseudomonas sp.]|nr:DEAD/DEAH box helicase [Pseudomonas sp.]
MLSAALRYKLLISGALARCFPRTTEYLRAEGKAALLHDQPRPRLSKANAPLPKAKAPCARVAKKPAKPRTKTTQAASSAIYGPALMAVDESQIAAMRLRVSQAVTAGLISAPSDEQWAMILGRNPLTRVFAAAGSGKSTTLLLRVVFMLCHLEIEPAQLTVISFTNASCAQLREQLLKLLGFWQFPCDANQARQCVRTFHSAMGVLAKEALGNPRWFEQLASSSANSELDNPLTSSRLRPSQLALLKQAYQQCYEQQPEFRQLVHGLLGLPAPPATENASKTTRVPKAPLDAYQLAGEFSPLPLFEAFYLQAGFIQSIGIRIDQLDVKALSCATQERSFVEALMLFWQRFEQLLGEQGLLTFDAAFAQLSDRLNAGTPQLSAAVLAPFSHLLIDEFQDISPQIVQWLNAVQRALVHQGTAVSLMAIGDDWQSIYGWRGSSPELFINFDKHFPGKGKANKSALLLLQNNYRSIEPIIRDGEAVLAGVNHKQAKTSNAVRATQTGDHGVKLVTQFELKTRLPELLAEIQAQCAQVTRSNSHERTSVLLLSRSNASLQLVRAQLDKQLPVKACTIHGAKGLQAEVAIILDDCLPPTPHPLRDALYAYSGFFQNSYGQAMQDESLRLAYVAITRGVSRVLWYCNKPQGATQILRKRGR